MISILISDLKFTMHESELGDEDTATAQGGESASPYRD
jgi:hypothetical protein